MVYIGLVTGSSTIFYVFLLYVKLTGQSMRNSEP